MPTFFFANPIPESSACIEYTKREMFSSIAVCTED